MKTKIVVIVIVCFGNLICFGQKKSIDPRQFVKISELNRQTNEIQKIYDKDSIYISKIDNNSQINIEFNQDSMSSKLDYYGNVSITAKINDELIKVSPYSKVGEKQGKIGINSASPTVLSSHIIGLIDQMRKLEIDIRHLLVSIKNSENKSNILNYTADIDYSIAYFEKMTDSQDTLKYEKLPAKIKEINANYENYSPILFLFSKGQITFTNKQVLSELKSLKTKTSVIQESNFKDSIESEIVKYQELKQSLELSKNYLIFFQGRDKEVFELYLRLFKQDKLAVDDFAKKLIDISIKLQELDTITADRFIKIRNSLNDKVTLLAPSVSSYNNKLSTLLKDNSINLFDEQSKMVKDESKKLAAKKLAMIVGDLIYQKLFTGTIDLRESRAKSGDILKISLLWYQSNDSLLAPLELELAAFDIKEIGWRLKVSDTFFLVNRISVSDNEPNVSPSKFKGAPGVSLMCSYGNSSYKNTIFKRLEPSIGLNISYLDFDTTKDLEVGVGAVLGLLHNQIFITWGYNIHSERNGSYIGLGFSFANIASQMKK